MQAQSGPRAVYIRRGKELAKHGLTPGCPGCEAVREGRVAVGHTAGCRKRIEDLMIEDEEGRARLELAVKRAKVRSDRITDPRGEKRKADIADE
eukprot:1929133-Amphidinium_carterae.1